MTKNEVAEISKIMDMLHEAAECPIDEDARECGTCKYSEPFGVRECSYVRQVCAVIDLRKETLKEIINDVERRLKAICKQQGAVEEFHIKYIKNSLMKNYGVEVGK